MSSIDWGDAPTWIAAVFAGGAALFAGLTIRSQRQQIAEQRAFIGEQSQNLALERAELQAAKEARRWAQAKQIEMRFATRSSGPDSEGISRGYEGWLVTVTNRSDEPARNLLVRFGDTYNATSATEIDSEYLPGHGRRGVPLDVLGPGRAACFESPRWQEATVDNNRPALQFTDAAGAVWRRDEHGVLTAVEE